MTAQQWSCLWLLAALPCAYMLLEECAEYPDELGFHTLAATALVLCSIASIVSSQFVAGVV